MRSDTPAARAPRAGRYAFALLLAVAVPLIVFKVVQQVRIGPYWDTYSFLANAAEFAGKGFGYSELHRPPLLSLVTAALFALGLPLQESVIQWVDGAVSLSGLVAFYLVTRRRFDAPQAAAAALLLLGVQPVWQFLGVGYTDFFSVSLSLWLLWAVLKATEEHPAWYLLAGPLFTAAVMTRYTAILAAFPVVVWVVLRWRPFHQARYLAGFASLAVATYALPAARFYATRFGDALFPFLVAFGMYEDFSAPTGQFTPDPAAGWLARSLPDFLGADKVGPLAFALLAVAGLGLAMGLPAFLQRERPRAGRVVLAVLACVPAALAQMSGGLVLRQATIALAVAGVWMVLGPREEIASGRRVTVRAALGAAMLAWLLGYFDFHGHERMQVVRYVITMAPPLAFFLVQGCEMFVGDIRRTLRPAGEADDGTARHPLLARAVVPLMVALYLVPTIAASMSSTAAEPPDAWAVAGRETGAYLRERPDIDGAEIFSDIWPITAWYVREPVRAMPQFADRAAYRHALDKREVTYYVTIRDNDYEGYEVGTRSGQARVLVRTGGEPAVLPRVAYLGKSWDNYLERVAGYSFYLLGDQGPQEWGEMVFLDSLGAAELSRYDAVAIYGVKWHNRATGERALIEYVEDGGSVVIDASANVGRPTYDLAGIVMLDTVIERGTVEPDAAISVGHTLLALDPALGDVDASPFVAPDGGPWYGARYATLPGGTPLEVLATIDGKPLVVMRRLGEGRIYWIGYNLVWHAFVNENTAESALVEAVFAHALSEPKTR